MNDSSYQNKSLYIKNLNEKVHLKELERRLNILITRYAPIESIKIRKSIKMRGQAFIYFTTMDEAAKVRKNINNLYFLGKQIRVEYAKTRVDDFSKTRMVIKFIPIAMNLEEIKNMLKKYKNLEDIKDIRIKNVIILEFKDASSCFTCYSELKKNVRFLESGIKVELISC